VWGIGENYRCCRRREEPNYGVAPEAEAHKYTSSLRTLYSVGGAKELALYKEILSGMTNVEENAQGAYSAKTEAHGDGTKTIYIGRDALADGSRFGMNILLAHESYRNGVDDGEAGQQLETDRAVKGHIGAAKALGQAYGMGSLRSAMAGEVIAAMIADETGNTSLLDKVLAGYESSADYWKLMNDGTLVYDGDGWLKDEAGNYINADGSHTKTKGINTIGAAGVETGLLNILNGGTHDRAYNSYSQGQILLAQKLMRDSGIISSTGNYKDVSWAETHAAEIAPGIVQNVNLSSLNMGKALNMEMVMNQFGGSIATEVFASYYYDEAHAIASNKNYAPLSINSIKDARFARLVRAMNDFYYNGKLSDDELILRQEFKGSYIEINGQNVYQDGQHKGEDFVSGDNENNNPEIYNRFSGFVRGERLNTSSSGYSTITELGYMYENTFMSTGVFQQQMHYDGESPVSVGDFVTGNTFMGKMGGSGNGLLDQYDIHLHTQLMGQYGGVVDPYRVRRDSFLEMFSAPDSSRFSATPTLSSSQYNAIPGNYRYNYFVNKYSPGYAPYSYYYNINNGIDFLQNR